MADRLCVGIVVGAQGVKGQLRIKSFTADPLDLTSYGPLETEAGESWRLRNVTLGVKGVVTATIDKIGDRNQAEAAKGVKLYVSRDALPAPDEDEFYVSDLIGLTAWNKDGVEIGIVTAIYDFGAGDVIEVKGSSGELLVPFTLRVVPEVDLVGRRLVIDPPLAVEGEEEAPPNGD